MPAAMTLKTGCERRASWFLLADIVPTRAACLGVLRRTRGTSRWLPIRSRVSKPCAGDNFATGKEPLAVLQGHVAHSAKVDQTVPVCIEIGENCFMPLRGWITYAQTKEDESQRCSCPTTCSCLKTQYAQHLL